MSIGIVPPEFPFQVAIGAVPGASVGTRRGRNDFIPTTPIIFSNVTSSAFPNNQPAVAQQMQVVSTSASDDGAPPGIGAQQVEITYLTAPFPTNVTEPFKKKTEVVIMNGTTPVLTNATDIFRIDDFRVFTAGAAQVAIGNILLQSVGGATTFEQINAGSLSFLTAAHYIENGFGSLITDLTSGCTTAAGILFFIVGTVVNPDGIHIGKVRFQTELTGVFSYNIRTPIVTKNAEGRETFFLGVARGRAANQLASCDFSFIDFPL